MSIFNDCNCEDSLADMTQALFIGSQPTQAEKSKQAYSVLVFR